MTDYYWNPLDYVVWFGHNYKTLKRRRKWRKDAFSFGKRVAGGGIKWEWCNVVMIMNTKEEKEEITFFQNFNLLFFISKTFYAAAVCTYILSGGGDDAVTATALLPENGDECWIALRNICVYRRDGLRR